ncbi:hypothetical protein BGX31_007613 [Mortierella sp. GBA43]|nr:hypothetical protein BGX31_007613 [Mortierella sp. GBA43]
MNNKRRSTRQQQKQTKMESAASSLYCGYLDNINSSEISFKGFLQQFKELTDSRQAIGVWSSTVLPYLASHPRDSHRRAYKRVSKQSEADRQAQFREVLDTRHQINALRPNVRRQELAISNLHAAEIEEYVGNEIAQATAGAKRSATVLEEDVPSDPLDSDYLPSQSSILSSYNEVPMRMDRLVGPGTRSSALHTQNRLIVTRDDGEAQDVSAELMSWRELNVLDNSELQWTEVNDILSLNFIFIHPLVKDLHDRLRKDVLVEVDLETKTFIVDLTEIAPESFETAQPRIRSLATTFRSPLSEMALSLCSTRVLWDDTSPTDSNEDTFIDRYVKPLIVGFFGDLEGANLYWTRDQLMTGSLTFSEQSFPDVLLAADLGQYRYTLVQVEAKGLGVARELLDRDRVKMFFNMKKSFDALCQAGVDGSTVGILVQGLKAEVWIMDLPFEGGYIPTHVGSFSLIHSNLAFGSILTLAAPMLTARRVVQQTLQKLREARRARPIKNADRRGQYDLLPVLVPVEEKTDEEATEGDNVGDE